MNRQIDGGMHLALASLYSVYKARDAYPQEFAKIMTLILELDRRHYKEGGSDEKYISGSE